MSTRRVFVLVLGLLGCRGDAPQSKPTGGEQAAERPETVDKTTAQPSHLDAQGRLLPSGRKIDWFEIPAGFESRGSRPQHHQFVSHQVSMTQLKDYLGPRMLTGKVDEMGEGAIYREVMPLSAEAGRMRFDVQVALVDQGTGVSLLLEERSFLGAPPLSASEAAKVLAEEQARAE